MGREFWANVTLCVILAGLFIYGLTHVGSSLTPKGLWVTDDLPDPDRAVLLEKILLRDDIKRGSGNTCYAGFYVTNRTDTPIKNIRVQCDFADRYGRHLDREEWVLPEETKAHLSRSYPKNDVRFIHSRAQVRHCRVMDFDIVAKPPYALARSSGGHGAASSSHDDQGSPRH